MKHVNAQSANLEPVFFAYPQSREDVQQAVFDIWPNVTTENLLDITDYAGYKSEFLKLFGFGRPDIDYSKDVSIL